MPAARVARSAGCLLTKLILPLLGCRTSHSELPSGGRREKCKGDNMPETDQECVKSSVNSQLSQPRGSAGEEELGTA